jgi:hypothetical protein
VDDELAGREGEAAAESSFGELDASSAPVSAHDFTEALDLSSVWY